MSDTTKRATVVDLLVRINVDHEAYELAYGTGVGDLPAYTQEQATEAIREHLTRLGWGEIVQVTGSHWTTAAKGEPGHPWPPNERPFTEEQVRAEVMAQVPGDYSPRDIDDIVEDVLAGSYPTLKGSVDRSIQGLEA